MATIQDEVRKFVIENFLFGRGDIVLDNETSFLENRIIDSTGVLELVGYLESAFGVHIQDEELDPENLDSLNRIAAFIAHKREQD